MIRRAIKRPSQAARRVSFTWHLEPLEGRRLMTVDISSATATLLDGSTSEIQLGTGLIARPVSLASVQAAAASATTVSASLSPAVGPAVSGPYTPTQIRHAYGFDQLSYDGTGQTIALIDAYDDPTAASDLASFSSTFGLPAANFQKVYYSGNPNSPVSTTAPAYNSGWALEISLDVQWAHAIAPNAKILLVEAPSASTNALFGAADYAVSQGASQVSMSFGGGEYNGDSSLDSHFNKPGVSFFASAGDSGAEVEFPAVSPYVVGVGGTTVSLDSSGNKLSETTWSGSGGGVSAYTSRPSFQNGFQTNANRAVPDVSYNADPNSGVYVDRNGSYYAVGGTSAGAPQWAGLAALVNQGRVANGLSTIGTGTTYGLNSVLYALAGGSSYTNPNGDFLDITSGNNNNSSGFGYSATAGYDPATGLGSPIANKLVPDLIAYGTSTSTGTPTVSDAGFETVAVGTGSGAYRYNPTGSAWTFNGGAGVAGNGSNFTTGNPAAPGGTQVAFLQNQGSITQTVTGWAAGSYHISFAAAQRGNFSSAQTLQVLVDGSVVSTIQPSGTSYATYATATFNVTAGNHTITVQGLAPSSGDNTAFLDNLAVTKDTTTNVPTVSDAGFETVAVGTGSMAYQYNPTGSAWTFNGGAGVAGNGSNFTTGNPAAPGGTQVAFLQNQGSITQTVTGWAAGSYHISFAAAQRGNFSSAQTLQVLVDGSVVSTIQPSGTSYATYATATFNVTAGNHTITVQGLAPSSGDNTAFLDNLAIVQDPTSNLPSVSDSSFENVAVGSGSAAYLYDPTGSAWTFSNQAGLSGNGSGFTSGNSTAPNGVQVAFLQNQGVISQTINNWAAGNYALTFSVAQRANMASNQIFAIQVDGQTVDTVQPGSTSYTAYTSKSFAVTAGSHTIAFVGMGPANGDNTVFLDNVLVVKG